MHIHNALGVEFYLVYLYGKSTWRKHSYNKKINYTEMSSKCTEKTKQNNSVRIVTKMFRIDLFLYQMLGPMQLLWAHGSEPMHM